MKTLLCCIARLENPYIREFVEYYQKLGFTNICICDNNRDGEDQFEDVIKDYIDSGFVFIKDYRNKTNCQYSAYNNVYREYSNQYDWFAFFDVDEFLVIDGGKTITEYLDDEVLKDYNGVLINWVNYNDNGNVYYEDLPLNERFTTAVNVTSWNNIPDSATPKCIARGGLANFSFMKNPHIPYGVFHFCDSEKQPITKVFFDVWLVYENVHFNTFIKHFATKSCAEYCAKLKRGFADFTVVNQKTIYDLIEHCYFNNHNERTKEKVDMFNTVFDFKKTPELLIQY